MLVKGYFVLKQVDAIPGSWPAIALINVVEKDAMCTGTLIDKNLVLTAAHW